MALCPTRAIKLNEQNGIYRPEINHSNCNSCGICVEVCPVIHFWERNFEKKREITDVIHFNDVFGFYYSLFFSYSQDSKIRYNCSSGGFVSSLLIYLLDNHIVDYVIVSDQEKNNFFMNYPIICKYSEDILKYSGSKYIPIAQSSILDQIKKNEGVCAFVGLPCHINGIVKALEKFPDLKKKIKFKISLFCGGTSNIFSTKYLLKLLNIDENEVLSISYRGEGWPGFFSITKKNGSVVKIPYRSKKAMGGVFSSPFFRPFYCTMCSDPFGRLSDVSVGDAWLKRFNRDKNGRNLILIRNKELNDIVKKMSEERIIFLSDATIEELTESTSSLIKSRYYNLDLKIKYFKMLFNKDYKYKIKSYEYYYVFDRFQILLFLILKKYIFMMDKKKITKHLPLWFILPFSVLNLIERNVLRK